MATTIRVTIATLVLMGLSTTTLANPLDWFLRHPVATKLLYAGVSAGVGAAGLHHCRTGGVERCDGKYGESWAIFGVYTGANFLMIPISEKIGGKSGAAISYGGSCLQLGHGIVEWRKDKTTHVDMSHVAVVHR